MTERFALVLLLAAVPLFFAGSWPAAFAYMAVADTVALATWAWDRGVARRARLVAGREHAAAWALDRPQTVVLTLTSKADLPIAAVVREALPEALDPADVPEPGPAVAEADLALAQDLALLALGIGLPGGADRLARPRPRRPGARVAASSLDERQWGHPDRGPEGEEEVASPGGPRDATAQGRPHSADGDLPVEATDGGPGPRGWAPRAGDRPALLAHPPALVPMRVTIPPHAKVALTYALTPRMPGRLDLGAVHVRRFGPLGLAAIQDAISLESVVDVGPGAASSAAWGEMNGSPEAGECGLIASRSRGPGFELESLRPYTPSDEFRRISWKASARRGRTVVRETLADVSQQVLILVDAGRAMGVRHEPSGQDGAPAGGPEASDPLLSAARPASRRCALDDVCGLALDLARRALDRDDAVGLAVFSDSVATFLKPRRGSRQWMTIVRALTEVRPTQRASDLEVAVGHVLAQVRRRTLVILLTQLPGPAGRRALKPTLSLLARRHALLVLTPRDGGMDALCRRPPAGDADPYVRASAARTIEERETAVADLRSAGIAALDVGADGVPPRLIAACLRAPGRRC